MTREQELVGIETNERGAADSQATPESAEDLVESSTYEPPTLERVGSLRELLGKSGPAADFIPTVQKPLG